MDNKFTVNIIPSKNNFTTFSRQKSYLYVQQLYFPWQWLNQQQAGGPAVLKEQHLYTKQTSLTYIDRQIYGCTESKDFTKLCRQIEIYRQMRYGKIDRQIDIKL